MVREAAKSGRERVFFTEFAAVLQSDEEESERRQIGARPTVGKSARKKWGMRDCGAGRG